MDNVTQVSNDVNTDEIPFYDETWDGRTNKPHATPLADLLEASRKPWQLATLERIVTDAWRLGRNVEWVLAPLMGREDAASIAEDRYNRYLEMCLSKIAWMWND